MSEVFNKVLPLFFDPCSHDFSRSGINLDFHSGGSAVLFADLDIILADEAELHAIYGCKGSSGLKPCLCCLNVYDAKTTRGIVEADRTGSCVYHTCSDPKRFKFATTEVIAAILRRLQGAAARSNTELEHLQTELGWKYVPAGIMYDPISRVRCCPSRVACFDWMHIIFVNGIFNANAGLMLHALRRLGIRMDTVRGYVELYSWPHVVAAGASPRDTFSTTRLHNSLAAKTLKCSASDGMSLVPVLAQFVETLKDHRNLEIRAHARCFLKFALVAGCLMHCTRGLMDRRVLMDRASDFVAEFRRLYGEAAVFPKFHYLLHLAFYKWKRLPSCWVHERKHKIVKRYADAVFNTRSSKDSLDWDASVLMDVTAQHIENLISTVYFEFSDDPCLYDGGKAPSRTLLPVIQAAIGAYPAEALRTAKVARVSKYEKVCVGDVVVVGITDPPSVIGEVVLHIAVTDGGVTQHITLLNVFAITSTALRHWKCKVTASQRLVFTQDIDCAAVVAGTVVKTVLKPLHATRCPDI